MRIDLQIFALCRWLLLFMCLMGCEKLDIIDHPGAENLTTTDLIDRTTASQIADEILKQLNANELVGVQVSIVDSTGETWTLSVGSVDIDRKEVLRDEHLFRIGSVSKVYTSTVLLSLNELGNLDLDQSIEVYFPDFPNAEKITIRHLLNHSSGIRDVFSLPDLFIESSLLLDKVWNHEEVAETCLKSKLLFDPGTDSHYSSANYILAAIVAEKATGRKILDLYNEIIFTPHGLQNTQFVPYEEYSPRMISGFVHHFALSLAQWYTHTPDQTSWSTAAHASGAIVTNSRELSWFTHKLFQEKILGPESVNEMTNMIGNIGLGLFEINVNGRIYWGHEGEIMGFEALTAYSPETKIGYSFCCNTTPYDIYQLLNTIERITYEAISN